MAGKRVSHIGVFIRIATICVFSTILWAPSAFAQEAVPGEYIIKMKGRPSSQRANQFLGKISGKAQLRATYGRLNIHHMRLKPGQSESTFVTEVANDPDIEYIEPNYIVRRAGGVYSQSGAQVRMTQAWAAMSPSASDIPVVAVIDSGIDYNHPVFVESEALWKNPGEIAGNNVDDDGNGYVDDTFGWNFVNNTRLPYDDNEHGTHVAGIVLGATQDILSASLEPARIRIMPLKFLSYDGSGTTSGAIQAIYYAVNNGANVINNSWGGGAYSQALHDALAYAYSHNVVIVNAAGNSGVNMDQYPMYPAAYPVPSSISVAATNNSDNLALFSNYGNNSVRMAAPGVGIKSTYVGGGFVYMDGTSMAAPFVAGLAALAWREAPGLSAYQIANLVVNSGANFAHLTNFIQSGNRADGYSLVMAAQGASGLAAELPSYSGVRSPAGEAGQKVSGCGSVAFLKKEIFRPHQTPPSASLVILLALLLLPILMWNYLRRQSLAAIYAGRRQHERFLMDSEIKVNVGGRELIGQMKTISVGGLSFKTADAMLEKGGVITVQIASPDGTEQVQVEGRIVWNEKNQAYGVQFQNAREGVIERIRSWTAGLARSSS